MTTSQNGTCKEHTGIVERVKDCEDNVKNIWKKWDGMQKMILAIFVALSLNLIGVIFLLLR